MPPPLLPLDALATISSHRLESLVEFALCLGCNDCLRYVIHAVVRSQIHHGNCNPNALTRLYGTEFFRYFDQIYCRGPPVGLTAVGHRSILPRYEIGPRLTVSQVGEDGRREVAAVVCA